MRPRPWHDDEEDDEQEQQVQPQEVTSKVPVPLPQERVVVPYWQGGLRTTAAGIAAEATAAVRDAQAEGLIWEPDPVKAPQAGTAPVPTGGGGPSLQVWYALALEAALTFGAGSLLAKGTSRALAGARPLEQRLSRLSEVRSEMRSGGAKGGAFRGAVWNITKGRGLAPFSQDWLGSLNTLTGSSQIDSTLP